MKVKIRKIELEFISEIPHLEDICWHLLKTLLHEIISLFVHYYTYYRIKIADIFKYIVPSLIPPSLS